MFQNGHSGSRHLHQLLDYFFSPKLVVSFWGSQSKGLQLSILESTLGSHDLGKLPYAQSRCVETAILLGTQWVVIPIP